MAYSSTQAVIGSPDISAVVTAGNLGDPTTINQLPSVTMETKLGSRVRAQDLANNWEAEFIYLEIPSGTTVTAGLLYQFDKNHNVVVVPAGGTSKNTGVAVVVAYTSVVSNASLGQFAWFLIQGTVAVLKTAVAIGLQQQIYMSATAGRIYATASAGKQILGARSNNTATASAGQSTVNVYFNFSAIEGT